MSFPPLTTPVLPLAPSTFRRHKTAALLSQGYEDHRQGTWLGKLNHNHPTPQVFVNYCDGASFAGNVSEPVVVNGTKMYFRGRYILDAVFDSMLGTAGLSDANELILKGGSAGGLAVYLHIDHVRELIPETVQVRSLVHGHLRPNAH